MTTTKKPPTMTKMPKREYDWIPEHRRDKIIGHAKSISGDDWYAIWPYDSAPYCGDTGIPELIVHRPACGDNDTSFHLQMNDEQFMERAIKSIKYLENRFADRWDIMRLFSFDGKYDDLPKYILNLVKTLAKTNKIKGGNHD